MVLVEVAVGEAELAHIPSRYMLQELLEGVEVEGVEVEGVDLQSPVVCNRFEELSL
jgi:hypothetical protein